VEAEERGNFGGMFFALLFSKYIFRETLVRANTTHSCTPTVVGACVQS